MITQTRREDDACAPANLALFTTPAEREKMAQAFDRFLDRQEAEQGRRTAAEIAQLKCAADVRAYQRAVRQHLARLLGDFPARTTLRPRIVGKLEFPDLTVEKIVFESQPRYYVTANLYLPKRRHLPAPGILVPCGHLGVGKTGEYGDAAQCLALKGYVAMVFDPTGQGERSECINRRTGRHLVNLTVCQHHWTGKPCLLTDTTLAGYRTWDGLRCLDYLQTRKEVDPRRIGVLGNSGGGAMTLLITAVDERVSVCVPSHPGGSCENLRLRGYEPPNVEMYALLPPRPCRILMGRASGEDAWHRALYKHIAPFYAAYGCPERLELVFVDGYHDLFAPKRVAACDWFNRWFGREGEDAAEPRFHRITARRLWCTQSGQVQVSLGGVTMQKLNSDRAQRLAPRRVLPHTKTELRRQRAELLAALRARICFRRGTDPLKVRFLGIASADRFDVERLIYESEPGMPIPALLFQPHAPRAGAPVLVHAAEQGKPRALKPASLPVLLACQGFRVLSIDARDTGEGALCETPRFPVRHQGKRCAYDPQLWSREMLAIRALGLGRTRSALRALDIIRAGDLLAARGLSDGGYAVAGEGQLGVCAIKAAAFDTRVTVVAAVRTMASYRFIVDHPYYNQYHYFWTPGALKDYDIPDLPALVAPRPTAFIAATDHLSRPVAGAELRRRFAYARAAYTVAGRPEGLVVAPARGMAAIVRQVAELIAQAGSTR